MAAGIIFGSAVQDLLVFHGGQQPECPSSHLSTSLALRYLSSGCSTFFYLLVISPTFLSTLKLVHSFHLLSVLYPAMVSLWERSGQPLVNETSSDSSSNDSTMPMSMTHDANRAVQPAAIAAFALVGVAVLALSLYLTFKLAMQKKARAREALLSSFSQVSTGSTLNSVDLEKKA
jgi:hypothetical protein